MRNLLLILFVLSVLLPISLEGQVLQNNQNANSSVVLAFITHNAYGNNLYIDNITAGNRFDNDVAVLGISNIEKDTSYTIGLNPFSIEPIVTIINSGKLSITSSFTVTLTVTPGVYSSTKTVSSLNSGAISNVTFDPLTVTPGTSLNLQVTSNLANDQNLSNNSFTQTSIIYGGVRRNVIFEQWTSSTCGPCATNNPTVDAFVANKFDSLMVVKYHVGWPSPGNDPMYLYNPTQSYDRRYYYGVNSVPNVIIDGVVNPTYPYTVASSLPDAFNKRIVKGTPLSLVVTETKYGTDSVKADVAVTIHAPLKYGSYWLRIQAIQKVVEYATAPGNNGERIFHDVFRKAYPSSQGIQLPTTVGTHNFSVTYPYEGTVWNLSQMYTNAFVQNDLTKEVINGNKSWNQTVVKPDYISTNETSMDKTKEYADDIIISENLNSDRFENLLVTGSYQFELFETSFPPSGWRIKNPDNGMTFAQSISANGPTLGGSKSVFMDFYSYSATGQKDTLISPLYVELVEADTIQFDYAYAQYSSTYVDSLIVLLSIDGGTTFPYTVLRKGGATLATAPATTNPFTPTQSQWTTVKFALLNILPVELSSFNISPISGGIQLDWVTSSELNNYGFEIQRGVEGSDFVTISFVKGNGTTSNISKYSFVDNISFETSTNISYRLKQVDFDGRYQYSNVLNVDYDIPTTFGLDQNYPNPFNPSTTINYQLPENGFVTLRVFDMLGKQVDILVNEHVNAGRHSITYNANKLSSGVYYYELRMKNYKSIKKFILMK